MLIHAADFARAVLRDSTCTLGCNPLQEVQDRGADRGPGRFLVRGCKIGVDKFARNGILAANLGEMDMVLLVLYIASMYLSVRYGSPPSSDPQQAQTQKIMAIVSPAMIAYFGWRYHWASALLIYWLALNVLTMAQQFFMYRKYGLIGAKKVAADPVEAEARGRRQTTSNRPAITGGKNGQRTSGRALRRSKR